MSKHMPPIPDASVSPKGPGGTTKLDPKDRTGHTHPQAEQNYAEEGQQGNTKQNTTNQGYQQNR